MADLVDNYCVRLDGYKRYKCDLCDYLGKQRKDIADHILTKRHIELFKKSIPIIIPQVIINTSPKNSPPNNKVRGKTYLALNCSEAYKINTKMLQFDTWKNILRFTLEQLYKYTYQKPNSFLEEYLIDFIKEKGINNFPIRCVDMYRKRFYYNDSEIGWTEDLSNKEVLRCIKMIFSIGGMYVRECINDHQFNPEVDEDNYSINSINYVGWGEERNIDKMDPHNKTKDQAKAEYIEGMNIMATILKIQD